MEGAEKKGGTTRVDQPERPGYAVINVLMIAQSNLLYFSTNVLV
jgi:hypothetical protein